MASLKLGNELSGKIESILMIYIFLILTNFSGSKSEKAETDLTR
jgi:hypothetical protein